MKNFKKIIALIVLLSSIGSTLQAQECFTTEVVEFREGNFKITVATTSNDVNIYDDIGMYNETCPKDSECSYTWVYQKPSCNKIDTIGLMCGVVGRLDAHCEKHFDGCIVIIDGPICPSIISDTPDFPTFSNSPDGGD